MKKFNCLTKAIMEKLSIGELQIQLIKPQNGLIGLASVVINWAFYLGFIGIHRKINGGVRLTCPTKQIGENSMEIFHPINREFYQDLESLIIKKLDDLSIK